MTESLRFEEDKERRLELKQRMEGFFMDERYPQNQVVIFQEEDPCEVKVDAKITGYEKPQQSHEAPADFFIGMTGEATFGLLDVDNDDSVFNCLKFKNATFSVNGKEIKFVDLCPKGVTLAMQPDSEGARYYSIYGIVKVEHMLTFEDFVAMLHEIGHAIDDDKHKDEDQLTRQINCSATERNAWAEAVKIAKKYNIPIVRLIREQAQHYLKEYGADNENVKKERYKK